MLGLLCMLVAAASATAKPRQRFFQTAGGVVDCELDDGGSAGLGIDAYCQTVQPARSVTLSAAGKVLTCTGQSCIGNAPDNVQTLKAGSAVVLGPFSCTVKAASVTCKSSSGGGFSISRTGVKRL